VRDGILNIDKPRGPTSHDVVETVRRLSGVRRVGHAGTLDPLASGVLLICVGRATRMAEYLMAGRKVYRAQIRLGVQTETYDAEGAVVAEAAVDVAQADIETALARFRGEIVQVPPSYSAVKHHGVPLHRLARRGISVRARPRHVEVYDLRLTAWDHPDLVLEITCSAGTYVRTLAHDLGQDLGCGACLAGLMRLASGRFHVDEAVSLESLRGAAGADAWQDMLQPMDAALAHVPALQLDAELSVRICHGQAVAAPAPAVPIPCAGEENLARVYGPDGEFLAVAVYDRLASLWRPTKVFCVPER
jgi:tRNA pseudouridine55 synthase